jgi:hypothetical protein
VEVRYEEDGLTREEMPVGCSWARPSWVVGNFLWWRERKRRRSAKLRWVEDHEVTSQDVIQQ